MEIQPHEKIRVVRAINSETELQSELLVPLFEAMGRYKVVHTHGPDERGVDIVLEEQLPYGAHQYTAILVKCKEISNATSGHQKELIGNLRTQLNEALAAGWHSLAEKRQVNYSSVIIATNKRVSNSARDVLINMGAQYGSTQVTVLEGSDLVPMIDQYLPSFYATRRGRLSAYLDALRAHCEKLTELQNIAIFKKDAPRVLDIFVSPLLYRIVRRPGESATGSTVVKARMEDILCEKKNTAIVAGPGAGKSTLIRAAALQLIDKSSKAGGLHIPVLCKARQLRGVAGAKDIDHAVNELVQSEYGVEGFALGKLLEDSSVTVYLLIDGLDEITEPEEREVVVTAIGEWASRYSRHRVVVASREVTEITKLPEVGFRRWEILPFGSREVRRFIERWFQQRSMSEQLLERLRDHELLERLPRTPLVVTLLAILFESESQAEIPSNLAELYSMFVDLLLGKWNLDRRVDKLTDSSFREHILRHLAYDMHSKGKTTIARQELVSTITTVIEILGRHESPDEVLRDLIEQSGLLLVNDRGDVEFRHLSFQEYFVARYFDKKREAIGELGELFTDDWWREVVYFFAGLRKDSEELLERLAERLAVERPESLRDLRLGPTLEYGYVLQASYLTPLPTRTSCFQRVLSWYADQVIRIAEEGLAGRLRLPFPPGVFVDSLLYAFQLHYRSRFLEKLYLEVWKKLSEVGTASRGPQAELGAFVVAAMLADLGREEPLIDLYDTLTHPVPKLALGFELYLRSEGQEKTAVQQVAIRKLALRLKREIRRGRDLYAAYFRRPRRIASDNGEGHDGRQLAGG